MKKIVLGLLLAVCATAFTSPVYAQSQSSSWQSFIERLEQRIAEFRAQLRERRNPSRPTPAPEVAAVPEIDAATAGLAIALTSGLFAVYRERRKSN